MRVLDLRQALGDCFDDLKVPPIFGQGKIVVLLGFREVRDIRYNVDGPLIMRVLSLKRLPDVATVSRALSGSGEKSVTRLRRLLGTLVLSRLFCLCVGRATHDFAGSVVGTKRHAQATAVRFKRKVVVIHNGRGCQENVFSEL